MCAENPSRGCAAARCRQSGQALVESLVAALVLVPFVLLIVWLGKVQSLQQATIAASRLLAFECAARPGDCGQGALPPERVDELRRRVFARGDVQPLTGDRMPDPPSASERNPLWVDRAGRPLLEHPRDIGARIDLHRFDAGLSVAVSQSGGVAGNAAQLLSDLAGPGRFGLEIDRGLVDAKVQAGISASAGADFRSQLDSIALRMRANTAILTDAWSASGPYGASSDSVASRVGRGSRLLSAYETSIDLRYAPTRAFLALMGAIGLEPKADAFRYHAVDVDRVPGDRIGVLSGDQGGPGAGAGGGRGRR